MDVASKQPTPLAMETLLEQWELLLTLLRDQEVIGGHWHVNRSTIMGTKVVKSIATCESDLVLNNYLITQLYHVTHIHRLEQ